MNEDILRAVIRESLEQQLDEGFLDWLKSTLGGRGAKLRRVQNYIENDIYPLIVSYYNENPRVVSKIKYHLDAAMNHMDAMIAYLKNPRRERRDF